MKEKNSKSVLEHMEQITMGNTTAKRLVFDPITQELVLRDVQAPQLSPDAITAEDPTRDGFFTSTRAN